MYGSHLQDVDYLITKAAMENITLRYLLPLQQGTQFESLLSVSFAHVETARQALRSLKTQQRRLHLVSLHSPQHTLHKLHLDTNLASQVTHKDPFVGLSLLLPVFMCFHTLQTWFICWSKLFRFTNVSSTLEGLFSTID